MSNLRREWSGMESAPVTQGAVVATHTGTAARTVAWRLAAIPVSLYVLAAALLLFDLGSHPNFTYNWENNTLDGLFNFMSNPGLDIFHLKEGLMTDSGSSPLVVLPALFGFMLGGEGFGQLRWPLILIAACAVPLLWVVGRRIAGDTVALLAAMLLALSPAYMLYARTATSVGISLVPMLLTVYILLRLLEQPGRARWAIALQGALVVGGFAYAPIRFLWPLSVGILLLEAWLRREYRKRLLAVAALTVVVLPCVITALDYDHGHDPVISVGYYYSGRGEQVANLLTSTRDYARSVGKPQDHLPSSIELLGQVVGQNSLDLVNLLLDVNTQPATTDFWNPQGRLIERILVPFFLAGLARLVWLCRSRAASTYRLLLLLFFGFTLPLLLTSMVHIGRLIFALPLLFLIVAAGFVYCLSLVSRMHLIRRAELRRRVAGVALTALLVSVAASAWNDYSVDVPSSHEARITRQLIEDAAKIRAGSGSVAIISSDDAGQVFESIDANQYRLGLSGYYCFRNLASRQAGPCPDVARTPALYVGGLLSRLQDPARMPHYCDNIYYVAPSLLEKFQAALRLHPGQCTEPIKYTLLTD